MEGWRDTWVIGKTKKIADTCMDDQSIYEFYGKSEKHVTGWIGGWMDGWIKERTDWLTN